jgi:hypothetical protein
MRKRLILYVGMACVLALSACSTAPIPSPTQDLVAIYTQAAQTVIAEVTNSASQTQAKTPAQTVASPTSTPPATETPIPATDTPLPITRTPSPSPSLTSLPGSTTSARLVYEADFSTGRGWHTEENDRFHFAFQDSGYVIGVDIRNAAVWSIRDDAYSDVILETSAQRLNGPQDGYYGVVCRQVDSDNYYGLAIGSDGAYGILKMMDGKMDFLVEGSAPGGVIHADTPNLVRGECIGETLTLFANDQKLAEAQDSDLGSGATGLLAGTHSNPGFEAFFKTFKIYQP